MTPEEFLAERQRAHDGHQWRHDDTGALHDEHGPLLVVSGGDPVVNDRRDAESIVDAHNTLPKLVTALEKVLELMGARDCFSPHASTDVCPDCELQVRTIQAITAALGGEEE